MAKKILCIIISAIILLSTVPLALASVPGDVNANGKLSSEDARIVLRASVELETLTEEQTKEADAFKDGKINAKDARTLLRVSVELETLLPYEEREDMRVPPINASLTNHSTASLIYCVDDSRILLEYEPDKKISTASTSKLLTAVVALSYFSPEEEITIGSEVNLYHPGSSLCGLYEGVRLTFYDLLTGLLVESGNEAAYVVAAQTARKAFPDKTFTDREAVDAFIVLMNEKAKSIGMHSSNFTSPEGWDDINHYSTVKDLLTLTKYALYYKEIDEIVRLEAVTVTVLSGETFYWENTNKLLRQDSEYYMPEATGIKTGTTPFAGSALISRVTESGKSYILINIGCYDDSGRYGIVKEMYELIKNYNLTKAMG